eukprot:8856123-Pyramimonas_sp.AAC.1
MSEPSAPMSQVEATGGAVTCPFTRMRKPGLSSSDGLRFQSPGTIHGSGNICKAAPNRWKRARLRPDIQIEQNP